jgi:hypothetical protein
MASAFWQKFWRESETLRMHIAIVGLLQLALLAAGLGIRGLALCFPSKIEEFERLEHVDFWASFCLLCLFAAYTVLSVTIGLIKSLIHQWRE